MQCYVIGGLHGNTGYGTLKAQLNGQHHGAQTPPVQEGSCSENVPEERSAEDLTYATTKIRLMLSIVRHDILNNISVIHGYNDLLSDRMPGDPEFRRNYTNMMRAVDCIEKQIDFTMGYLDTCSPHSDWCNLESAIQGALSGYTITNVRVSVDVGSVEILADPLMTKVFANLIDNAVRHGGPITEIRITFFGGEDHGLITVEDDGIGVLSDEKNKIFSPGYGHNTGMGLYLTRMILATAGFSIREAGREGCGARFEIWVPPGHYRIAG